MPTSPSGSTARNKKHLKNVGPVRHCEPPHAACSNFTLPFTRCRYCRTPPMLKSMSTTTTTTMHDRGDRYGPIEWAQLHKTGCYQLQHGGATPSLRQLAHAPGPTLVCSTCSHCCQVHERVPVCTAGNLYRNHVL